MWPLIKLLPEKTNFKFVKYAKIAGFVSVVLVIASLAMTIYPLKPPCGGLNCGVDFKGGTVLEVSKPSGPIDLAAARSAMNALNVGDVQVQAFGSDSDALIRFETPAGESPDQTIARAQTALRGALGEDIKFLPAEVVGPKVSGELFTTGLVALGVAIALMLVYIWFRFELQFGLGAVVGLFHDIILTFGLFALFKLEFTLTAVAAMLTIIGYSMNDTVVVFDRLRENLRKYKKMPLGEVIDLTINETLSRTIITGATGLLALTGLALLGGPALFAFSVAMIFGIVVGTYSSIYVAAPVIMIWGVKRGDEEELQPVILGGASKP